MGRPFGPRGGVQHSARRRAQGLRGCLQGFSFDERVGSEGRRGSSYGNEPVAPPTPPKLGNVRRPESAAGEGEERSAGASKGGPATAPVTVRVSSPCAGRITAALNVDAKEWVPPW